MDQKRMKTCPFNPSHVIEERRWLVHIERCKKTASNLHEFGQCRYNATHYVKRAEMETHEENCPNRLILDKILFEEAAMFQVAELVDNTAKLNLEDWDQISSSIPFNPEKQLAKTPYMTVPQGLSKADRKTHWMKERERLQELQKTRAVEEKEAPPPEDPKKKEAAVTRLPSSRIAARLFTAPDPSSIRNQEEPSRYVRPPSDSIPIGRGRGLMGLLQREK